MNQQELHEKILYPVTRVKTGKAGGSGVLVYSEPDPKEEGKYIKINWKWQILWIFQQWSTAGNQTMIS